MDKPIPWWQPQTSEEDIARVSEVLRSNQLGDGAVVREFEKRITELLGCTYALMAPSGTAAITMGLIAAGVGPGDDVLVPDLTWVATATGVEMCGAKVVLVDIDPTTLNMSPEAMRRAITPRTKAIVPVHVSGRACDMEAINVIAKEHTLAVIEDAAEALMSKHRGKYLGTWSNAGAFSMSIFKLITSGQGGFIVTDDQALYEKMRELRNQGLPAGGQKLLSRIGNFLGVGASGSDERFNSVGYNFKTTNVLGALALGQLSALDFRMERIRRTYTIYKENLAPGTITLFPFDIQNGELPLWIDAYTPKRDELCKYLQSKQIETRPFWLPLHQQKIYQGSDASFPAATAITPQSFWLPSAFTMTDDDALRVCKEINTFFGK
jgi:perosamine synthetase